MATAINPCNSLRGRAPRINEMPWPEIGRADLAEAYRKVRAETEALSEGLSEEDQNLQSMTEASPVKWHRAHTSWFYETFVLKPGFDNYRELDPTYAYLFNSYYNGIGEQYPRARRGLISRPSCAQVSRYRAHVDGTMLDLIESAPEAELKQLVELIVLGLNHEQQHQELIVTDLKHAFGQNPLHPAWTEPPDGGESSKAAVWTAFEGGILEIGADGQRFCFDNEMPQHRQVIDDFELADRPVTCGEFIEFIESGGYTDPALWLADGWDWLKRNRIDAPAYWQRHEGQWHLYTLGGLRRIDENETLAHVSYYEAQAFAEWAGARLPTETEWEIAAAGERPQGDFADSRRLHPRAAGDAPGLRQIFGTVWEWTASPYAPYPGYSPPAGTIGEYNGKFMANQMVLRGGSCATPAGHIRATYRNFFYPGDRWQFSGIRLARRA